MNQRSLSPKHQGYRSQQRGIALIVTLILLLTMTLVGLAGMRSNTQQERMAGNVRDRNLAFQANEAFLRHAEVELDQLMNYPFPYCRIPDDTEPLPSRFDDLGVRCIRATVNGGNAVTQVWEEDADWWENTDNTVTFSDYAALLSSLYNLPRVVIEVNPPETPTGWGLTESEGGAPPELYASRITVRATGGSRDAVTMIQSIMHSWDFGS